MPGCNVIDQSSLEDVVDIARIPQVAAFYREGCFKFMSLPPELRNIIYWFYLVEPFPLQIYDKEFGEPGDEAAPGLVKKDLALFQVNRQIWTEASPIFYAHNIFSFNLDMTGRPKPSEQGFHPNLRRMRKCHVWNREPDFSPSTLRSHFCGFSSGGIRAQSRDYSYIGIRAQLRIATDYARSLTTAFVGGIADHRSELEYLLVDLPFVHMTAFTPLAYLRNIRQVQIKSENTGNYRVPVLLRRLKLVMESNLPWYCVDISQLIWDIPKPVAFENVDANSKDEDLGGIHSFQDVLEKAAFATVEPASKDQEFETMKSICGF